MTTIFTEASDAVTQLEELKAQMSNLALKAAQLHRKVYEAEIQKGGSGRDLAITLCTEAALWKDAGRIADAMIVYEEVLALEITEKYETWAKKQLQILKLKTEYLKHRRELDDM